MPDAADTVISGSVLESPARLRPAERGLLRIGVVQERFRSDQSELRAALAAGVEAAAAGGAAVVFLQELTLSPYFAAQADPDAVLVSAEAVADGPTRTWAGELARTHRIAVHASLWEQASDGRRFNTAICVGPDGSLLAATRKFHIPHFPGYHEHRYFSPGDSQPRPVELAGARIGFPTCWDQWFPELSRSYALAGADVLAFPTAIGSEPEHPGWDTQPQWRAAMVGQAVTNGVFVVAINRVGSEGMIDFYGSSFVCDPYGRILVEAPRGIPATLICDLDLDARRDWLEAFPLLSDRRPDIYTR
ncbi:MAG: hydrolase [Candidatus Dormibacteria bacterium]